MERLLHRNAPKRNGYYWSRQAMRALLNHDFALSAVMPIMTERDGIYLTIRHRYRLFGQREACFVPRPEWADRLL